MAAFRSGEAGYGDGEPNDTAGWYEIDVSRLQPPDRTPIPFRLLANRFKSSSPDSEAFIHDPLTAMIGAASEVEAFKMIDRTWHVTTFVTNHHRTLSWVHVYAMAAVNQAEQTVAITIVKLDGTA